MKRKTQLKRRKALKKSSQKRAKEMALYRKERDIFIHREMHEGRWFCPVMWELKKRQVAVTEVHHKRGRTGKLLRDQRYWLAISRSGHDWVHQNPRLAREKGWLI